MIRIPSLVAIAFISMHCTAIAGFLFQDDFNSENGGVQALNFDELSNWNVTAGTIDLIGEGDYDFVPGNGMYLDLDGSTKEAGTIETKEMFSLTPGVYELSFDLENHPFYWRGGNNEMTVSLGSVYEEVFSRNDSSSSFEQIIRNIEVQTPANARLIFSHGGGDNFGLLLDNVGLRSLTGNPVPEPSSVFLFGGFLVGLFISRHKNRSQGD